MTAPYEQWVWVEVWADGKQGMISAAHPALGNAVVPFATRIERAARDLEPLARKHGECNGRAVRLVHMREVASG